MVFNLFYNKMSIESKVELLWNCALALKGDQNIHKILKSYYLNICRKLSKNNLLLPKVKLSCAQMCSHCGNFWYEGQFRMKYKPKHLSTNTKTKKLIEKLEKCNNSSNGTLLNKRQRKRAKWLNKKVSNNFEIQCDNCKRKSILKLETVSKKGAKRVNGDFDKYKQLSDREYKIIVNAEKDKKAGNIHVEKKQAETTQSKTVNRAREKFHQMECKSVQRKIKTRNITAPRVISKTQQQNNLLQLAALLKKNPQKESKYNMSKLESFLK